MATRLFSFFLINLVSIGALLSSSAVYAQSNRSSDPLDDIVAPDLDRREIKEGRIDTENWEVGVFAGAMNIEDFGTNAVYGVRAAYHITEGLFVEATIGVTEAGETSFETLSGATQILTDDQRNLTYGNISVGYNLFQGEVFFGRKRAYNTNFYIVGGVGNTDFANDNYFTYNLGVGTRIFFTDWLAVHGDVRAHSFSHELLGEEKTIINLEPNLGMTIYF